MKEKVLESIGTVWAYKMISLGECPMKKSVKHCKDKDFHMKILEISLVKYKPIYYRTFKNKIQSTSNYWEEIIVKMRETKLIFTQAFNFYRNLTHQFINQSKYKIVKIVLYQQTYHTNQLGLTKIYNFLYLNHNLHEL